MSRDFMEVREVRDHTHHENGFIQAEKSILMSVLHLQIDDYNQGKKQEHLEIMSLHCLMSIFCENVVQAYQLTGSFEFDS